MAKKLSNSEVRGSVPTVVDVRKSPIDVDGRTYNLCFDFVKLAEAERFWRRQGQQVNLLVSLPDLSLNGVRDAFPVLVHTFHPELSFDQAQALVTLQSVYSIATAIVQALNPPAAVRAEQIPTVEASA